MGAENGIVKLEFTRACQRQISSARPYASAKELGVEWNTVDKWRKRWEEHICRRALADNPEHFQDQKH